MWPILDCKNFAENRSAITVANSLRYMDVYATGSIDEFKNGYNAKFFDIWCTWVRHSLYF